MLDVPHSTQKTLVGGVEPWNFGMDDDFPIILGMEHHPN